MRRYIILIHLAVFIIIFYLSGQAIASGMQIIQDVVFETKPGEPPYYLPIDRAYTGMIYFTPWHGFPINKKYYSNSFGSYYAPATLGYFWALNNSEIVFINKHENKIHIINVLTGACNTFKPKVGEYDRLLTIWVGPQDDIYAELAASRKIGFGFSYPDDNDCKLFRFEKDNGQYDYDDKSDFPKVTNYPRLVRISPLNNLFINGWPNRLGLPGKNIVFNKYGQELRGTNADGETLCGDEFEFITTWDKSYNVVKVKNLKTGEFFMFEEVKHLPYIFNFKYTLTNNLVLYCHHQKELNFDNNETLFVNIPTVLGEDITSGYHYVIDLDTLAREDYKYYNISDVSISYSGDIYALAVYFNNPRVLTGDELIVLYRWRISEKP